MKRKILIDMFSVYKQVYSSDKPISEIVSTCLHKINLAIPSDADEVYFIFESRPYEKESYENRKQVKINKKRYESYEMGKNYVGEILKSDSNKFKLLKILKQDHDYTFTTLCSNFKDNNIEIYSYNMLLCKNLALNIVYKNENETITLDSFIDTFGFVPNKYSITFYFFLKSYIESEVMAMIMRDYNRSDSFNSFNLYTKSLDFETQNKIKKTIRQIKDIFEFYDYKKDTDLDLDYMIHNCKSNPFKKELLMDSIGIKHKKCNNIEKFFNV